MIVERGVKLINLRVNGLLGGSQMNVKYYIVTGGKIEKNITIPSCTKPSKIPYWGERDCTGHIYGKYLRERKEYVLAHNENKLFKVLETVYCRSTTHNEECFPLMACSSGLMILSYDLIPVTFRELIEKIRETYYTMKKQGRWYNEGSLQWIVINNGRWYLLELWHNKLYNEPVIEIKASGTL